MERIVFASLNYLNQSDEECSDYTPDQVQSHDILTQRTKPRTERFGKPVSCELKGKIWEYGLNWGFSGCQKSGQTYPVDKNTDW